MKTSLFTSISIAGVLATGGAAFAANSTVLDSILSPEQGSTALEEAIVPVAELSIETTDTGEVIVVVDTTVLVDSTLSSVPTSVPIGELDVSSSTSVPSSTTTIAPGPTTTVAPGTTQFSYSIPGVGVITLRQDATSLTIVSVTPVSGWTFDAEQKKATRVEVEFENGNKDVKFRAELLDGRVIAAVKFDDDDEVDDDDADEVDDDDEDELDDDDEDELDDDDEDELDDDDEDDEDDDD